MATRIASVNYLTFLQCYQNKLWGANNVYISKWSIGDHLVFKIKDNVVAISEIIGEAYMDNKVIWDNGLFWNRIPLNFIKVFKLSDAISFEELLKPHFLELWGKKYGWVILNKHPLPDEIVTKIISAFELKEDDTSFYRCIDNLIAETRCE